MTARAATITLVSLGLGALLWQLSAAPQSPKFFAVGPPPAIARPWPAERAIPAFAPGDSFGRHSSPYMMSPRVVGALHNIEVDPATKAEILGKLDASVPEDVQRSALVSIFRLSRKTSAESNPEIPSLKELLEDPSGEAAKQAAAYQIFFMARDDFDGTVKDFVDVCLKGVLLKTQDPKERVDILDTCFYAFPAEYKDTPVESGMRLFRMLLDPKSANIITAKKEVRGFITRLNQDTAKMVEKWMRKTETGKMAFSDPSDFAEDCRSNDWDMMDMWMPMMPRAKHERGLGAYECFSFEESLRNYQAVVTDLQGFAP
jgi:hypothetical protein